MRYYAPENELGGGGSDVVDTPADTSGSVSHETNSPAEPVSMEDTIRSALKETSSRTREPNGRFSRAAAPPADAPATDDAVTPAPAEPGAVEQPAVAAPDANTNPDNLEYVDASGAKKPININEAPASVRPEVKAAWQTLPESIRREFHKRENDFFRGTEQYRAAANFAVQIGSQFKPHETLLKQQGWTPHDLTREFITTHAQLSQGDASSRAQAIIGVAERYGLTVQDLQTALGAVQSGQNPVQPQQTPREVLELRQRMDQIEQARIAEQQATLQSEIDRFKGEKGPDGKLLYEHFDAVQKTMGALLSAGEATDLKDAYNKAIWANPQIQAKLLAQQEEAKRKIAADKAAAAKKAASVNVVTRGKHPASAPVGTMDDTIRANLRRMNGGA